jgi:hypothetical protein
MMKKIIIFYFLCLCLFSCKKENEYFTSNEVYNTVIKSVDGIHSDISKTDKIFYVLNRHDTLIVFSSEHKGILYPTAMIKKKGSFLYKNNKIIVTQPYKQKYQIVKKENSFTKEKDFEKVGYYSGNDYPKGFIYKIKDLNHLELIDKGDLTKYFYRIKEYEIPMPPPPSK